MIDAISLFQPHMKTACFLILFCIYYLSPFPFALIVNSVWTKLADFA